MTRIVQAGDLASGPFTARAERAKRALDLTLAALLTPVLLPVAGIIAVAITVDSGGPALFRQKRVGRNGAPFTIYKFRTMQRNTADAPSHLSSRAQLTRLGPLLRRAKLDEIPQLINIFRGDMSFVGPRPCLTSQTELIEARTRLGVSGLKPGITGPGQIAGLDMSAPEELARADAGYVARWSIWRDLALMWHTGVGRGSGDAIRCEGKGI
jgi:O-antigen biosynthesis protein WbqP